MAVKTIADEIREHADKARALLNKAKAEDRDLSEAEQAEYTALTAAMTTLTAKRTRNDGFADMLRAVEAMAIAPNGRPGDGGTAQPLITPANVAAFNASLGGVLPFLSPNRISLGSAFVDHEAIRAVLEQGRTGTWATPAIEIDNLVTIVPAGAPIPPGTQIIPPTPPWPELVAPRFAQGTTDAGSIPYLQETSFTNLADYVAAGAPKPESDKVFTLASATLLKIAHIIRVPDEFLDDIAGLRSFIDANMANGIVEKTEKEIINGAGGAGKIQGLLTLPGLTPATAYAAGPFISAIAAGAAAVWTASKRRPDTVVLSPNTYLTVAMQTSSAGGFLLPNALTPTAQPLYGLTPVQSPFVPDGTAIVGAFQQGGMLFRKGGIAIQATNSHADDFQKNITAIRAEIRLALAYLVPAAFTLVTGLVPPVPGP